MSDTSRSLAARASLTTSGIRLTAFRNTSRPTIVGKCRPASRSSIEIRGLLRDAAAKKVHAKHKDREHAIEQVVNELARLQHKLH